MPSEASRKAAQEWVYGHADHECGSLLGPGHCTECDAEADRLAIRFDQRAEAGLERLSRLCVCETDRRLVREELVRARAEAGGGE